MKKMCSREKFQPQCKNNGDFTPFILLICFVLTLLCVPKTNADNYFVAQPNQSLWSVTIDSPIQCRIEHKIPLYGVASFTSRASKKINLDFELMMYLPMGKTEDVSLMSVPPKWIPSQPAKYIERLKFYKQFDGYVGGQAAWTMLSTLENGYFPTFSFSKLQSNGSPIDVALSAVSFREPYNDFNRCIARLLPYSFEDIAFTVLHYAENGHDLNQPSMAKLAQIAEFVRYSPDIDLILMATYTDSTGSKQVNQRISEIRSRTLETYFLELGLPKDRIEVQAFGELRAIADNNNPIGRNKNRRVVISLGRSIF